MLKRNMPPDGWRYRHMAEPRLELLTCKASLDELIAEVLAGVVVDRLVPKEPCGEAKRHRLVAHRIAFRLDPVDETTRQAADRLLNGAYGLRAGYCRSPDAGSSANGAVCRALVDAIRARALKGKDDTAERQVLALSDVLAESLARTSAKVWFDDATDKRPARLDDGEVFSDAWTRSRDNPRAFGVALPELSPQQIEASLAKGRSVPRPIALDVKAAFTTQAGTEYVPASKTTRSLQIHLMGWT